MYCWPRLNMYLYHLKKLHAVCIYVDTLARAPCACLELVYHVSHRVRQLVVYCVLHVTCTK